MGDQMVDPSEHDTKVWVKPVRQVTVAVEVDLRESIAETLDIVVITQLVGSTAFVRNRLLKAAADLRVYREICK